MEHTDILHAQTVAECLRTVLPDQTAACFPAQSTELARLESKLAGYVGANFCTASASGTSGMIMALEAAGVREGDSVLCTSFSYFATAEIILLAGAVPMLVDTNPNTFNIDPFCLEYVLGKCSRTHREPPRALVASDIFGLPCNYIALQEICDKHGVALIEDMSQSFGAEYSGRKAGSFGRFAVASFFPARPLGGLGEGGCVFCRDQGDAQLLRELRAQSGAGALGSVQASVIGEKLKSFDRELARRQIVAARYCDNFEGYVKVQQVGPDYISAYTQFIIALADEAQRERVQDSLAEMSIPCSVPHSALRAKPSGGEWERVVLQNTQSAASRLLSLPMNPYLSNHVIDYISECVMLTVENNE